jgi:hypothetical protein
MMASIASDSTREAPGDALRRRHSAGAGSGAVDRPRAKITSIPNKLLDADFECAGAAVQREVKRRAAKPICYQCTAAEWKSWAEDNYDFESVKACRGVPSDAETKELSQTFCYSNDMEMRQAATQRHFTNQAKHSRKPPKPLEAR